MVLGTLTGLSVNLLIIIMGVIAIIYSYTGGLKSVLWTDFIQGSVLLIGVTFALVFLILHIEGGAATVFTTLAEGKFLAEDQAVLYTGRKKRMVSGIASSIPNCANHIIQVPA